MHLAPPCSKRAFSLVELSIVLVILGLLVGGVLSGKALIKSAETRKYLTDADSIRSAYNQFREKYMTLPGDMNNATQFWGPKTAVVCWSGIAGDYTEPTKTCNGNGNGIIETHIGYMLGNSSGGNTDETFYIWQHLSLVAS